MTEEIKPRVLYVGNLDRLVNEELLCTLFSNIGSVMSARVVREQGVSPYAFLEFDTHSAAATALSSMNGRLFLNKQMRVNWASGPGNQAKPDTSSHYHVFVGDLNPEMDANTLQQAFAVFGEISNCHIVRHPETLESKGYAFLSYVQKADAELAISSMNGQWLAGRNIRTNWSTRKTQQYNGELYKYSGQGPVSYEDLYKNSSPTNCTVYCGGILAGMTEELMLQVFSRFGAIVNIRAFRNKGYAFIKFSAKVEATAAIEAIHNTTINGYSVKCSWGKESGDQSSVANLAAAQEAAATAISSSIPTHQYGEYGEHYLRGLDHWYPYAQKQGQGAQAATNFGEAPPPYKQYFTNEYLQQRDYPPPPYQMASGNEQASNEQQTPAGAYSMLY